MTLAAILALLNTIVTAAANAARAVIELIPWSNPIVWVVVSFIGGCEYGREHAVQQVNETRQHDERPVIVHPFRPWLGVSEAEGGEIAPNPIEPFIDDSDCIAYPPREPDISPAVECEQGCSARQCPTAQSCGP